MKKILIILFLLIQSIGVYCQTYQPSQTLMNYGGPRLLDTCSDFLENNFVIGWHWYSSYKMSQAQDINMIHVDILNNSGWVNPGTSHIAHNARMIMNLPCIGHNNRSDNNFVISNNIALQYEPTYKVDTSNPGATFTQRKYDTTRYAFGFANVRGFIDTARISINYNRLQLFNIDSLRGGTVLSEPWMNNVLSTTITADNTQYHDLINDSIGNIYNKTGILTHIDTIYAVDWKGINFYININLRRLDSLDQTINNDTILEIRMPYITLGSQNAGYIRFDSLPCKDYNSTYLLPNSRGLIRNDTVSDHDSVLYITRNMIPTGNENDRDITISAFFICDKNVGFPKFHNYFLKGVPTFNKIPIVSPDQQIDQLKIEVKYRGNCNIGIDWISINTRPTRELGMGFFDNTIKNKLQECLDTITSKNYSQYGIKPFRWYLTDEAPPTYWFTRHYFTKLIGKVFTMEGCQAGTHYIGMPQYKYYCNIPEVWLGSGGIYSWMAVPYIPYISHNTDAIYKKNFGWTNINPDDGSSMGYREFDRYDPSQSEIARIKNSNYETMRYDKFYDSTTGGHGTQLNFEMSEQYMFENKENQFLFDSIPWWEQTWNDSRNTFFPADSIKSFIHLGGGRILTGEEIRYFMTKSVLDGAKGFIMDGEDEYGDSNNGAFNLHNNRPIDDPWLYASDSTWYFLDRDEIGGDYLDLTNPDEPLSGCFKMDTISKYLHIDKNRYYLGRKSVRRERYKIAEWIKACEIEIMPLKLVAMYSKGFQKLYVQDPKLKQQNILSKYINLDSIKTRYPGRSTYENHTIIHDFEKDTDFVVDSGFYHLTLLKNKNGPSIDSCFYLGVANKRVGPHIVFDSADVGKKDSVAFIPTAELEDNIIQDSTKWKKYFWKRLGTREMEIKFNYIPEFPDYPDEYDLLRITEIGYDNTHLNQKPWRQPDYYSRIDTVIGQDRTLKLKLLAGEGKILKITVLRPPKIAGNLAHSNQSKLIYYPVLDASGNETGEYRYHLVYFKPLAPPNSNKNGVYYRRSKKITKDCSVENISWDNEICLSDNIRDDISTPGTTHFYMRTDSSQISCDYPSIVLRNNYSSVPPHLYAYIVYSCAACNQLIVETMIDLFDTTSVLQGHVLSTFVGDDHYHWGNPVINASSEYYPTSPGQNDMNFYAWSDQNLGIVAAAKFSRIYNFDTTGGTISKINIHWKTSNNGACHPSLNVYSHINNTPYEDNCALVWQEPDSVFNNQIYYTRLRFNTSQNPPYQIIKYLPPNYQYPNLYHVTCNNNMAKLSNDINYYYDNAFPVVYRSLNYQGGYLSGQINRLDRVYWENLLGTNIDGKGPRVYAITLRPIDLYDNNNVAVNWNVFSTSIICSQTGKLYQPNITQGYPVPNSGHYGTGLLLDCKLVTSNSSLIELAHDINTLVSPTNPGYYYIEPFNWVKNITSVGNIPHLAMHYNIMDSVHSWLNRRVYNLFDPNPSTIMASAKFAYKEVEDYTVNEGLVGFKSDSSKYFIYLPLLNNQIIGLHLPFMESIDSLGNTQFVRTPCDTIFSDWFTVGDMSTLNFKCKGYDTTKTKIVIQKNSNGQIYNLEIPEFTTDTSGKLCCNILLNGQDNEYRMLMINRDSNSSYSEEVWLGGLPVDTMLFANKAGVTMGYNIVDLGGGANDETLNQNMTLSIHPNPANDVVYINGLLPVSVYLDNGNTNVNHKIKYSVYSQIGCVQMTAEGSPGETVTINTSGLSAGVYFIRAEHSSDIFYNPVSPVMGSFVITR